MQGKNNKIALVVVLLLSFVIYYFGTDGFTAFTAETARTNDLIEQQPSFPDVTLEDSLEQTYSFSEFEGKYVFITFFYTACDGVCPELEMNMGEVHQALPEKYVGEDIVFLSISFDPERDTPYILDRYRQNFDSDGETWRMVRIEDQQELDALLDQFGVVVIPDGQGHFTHNSAFYLVNPEGTLIDVMDFQDVDGAIERVERILESGEGV